MPPSVGRLVDRLHDAEEDLSLLTELPALRQAMRAGSHHGAGKRRKAVDVHGVR